MQQGMRALESDPGMIERMMSDPNLVNIAGSALGRGASGTGTSGGGGADPFASGPEGMRAQMEAFERLSRMHGGNSGGFNVGGGGGGGGAPPVATARPSSNGVAGGGNRFKRHDASYTRCCIFFNHRWQTRYSCDGRRRAWHGAISLIADHGH